MVLAHLEIMSGPESDDDRTFKDCEYKFLIECGSSGLVKEKFSISRNVPKNV